MSIGYRVDAVREVPKPGAKPDEDTGRVPTQWEVERWTPLEGSIVPVPADITVGIERADDERTFAYRSFTLAVPQRADEARRVRSKMDEDENTPAPAVTVAVESARSEERTRANEIRQLSEFYKVGERAEAWINKGTSVDAVKLEIFSIQAERASAQPQAGAIELTPKEARSYQITRAMHLRASGKDWDHKGCFEREVSDAISERMSKAIGRAPAPNGFFLPLGLPVPVAADERGAERMQVRAALTGNLAGTNSIGGYAVATQLLPFIELLRNRMFTRQLGARVLTGLSSNIAFPRQLAANTLGWDGEDPSTAHANTALTLNQLTLTPKTAMVGSAISRQAAFQSTPDLEAMIMQDIASVFAIGFDLAGINGQGTLEPTGIIPTSGVTVRALATNGANLAWADIVGLETDVATANADLGALAYLTTPGIRGKAKQTLKSTVAGAAYLYEGSAADGEMNGYPARASNQVPSNFTKGTSTTICHGVLFGNWNELIYGEFGGAVELLVDPYTAANQGMIQFHGIGFIDVGLRHPASFSVIKDALTT